MKAFIEAEYENMLATLKELCAIPAPSGKEEKRAEYIKSWLDDVGAENVYIDGAKNVVYPVNCESAGFAVFCAHTDTVFPDTEPMPVSEDEKYIYSPGVGDDTASVAVLMYAIKYLIKNNLLTGKKVMFVFNSCEEGLGDLKGVKHLFKEYGDRIKTFISFDHHSLAQSVGEAVGSHRYKVAVKTKGGHSFTKFGAESAVNALAKMICAIYSLKALEKAGTKTTYNVGTVTGGTSVNTIPQYAEMLCEYRSNDRECLDVMKKKFAEIFDAAKSDSVTVEVIPVGERPCTGDIDKEKQKKLTDAVSQTVQKITGTVPELIAGSTDCNIPFSLGINALCVGVYNGSGSHTREEKAEKASLKAGLEIAISLLSEGAIL